MLEFPLEAFLDDNDGVERAQPDFDNGRVKAVMAKAKDHFKKLNVDPETQLCVVGTSAIPAGICGSAPAKRAKSTCRSVRDAHVPFRNVAVG